MIRKIIMHKDIKKSAELRSIAMKNIDMMEHIDVNFVQLGPTVIPNGQRYDGKSIQITGRVTDIAIDYTNRDIIWVATSQGGLWKTIDGGSNWIPKLDSQKSLSIGTIALHPSNPNILYAGTGDPY